MESNKNNTAAAVNTSLQEIRQKLLKIVQNMISKQKTFRPSNEESFLPSLYQYYTHTHAFLITIRVFPAHPHFLAHQVFFLVQHLPVPLLRHSSPLHLPHLSVCLFCYHSSDSSSQHLNQIFYWITVSSLLCGNNREDGAPKAKGNSLLTPPSYIRSFLSLTRTALQHESAPADILFRMESQALAQQEKPKCRLWEQQSLGGVHGGIATQHCTRSTHCSFLEGSFFPQCSG